jgi:TonB-dependent receptor
VTNCRHLAAARSSGASPSPLRLPTTLSALATILALSAPAHAQQAGDGKSSEGSETLQEVVVTGLRQSVESAQAIKKNSDQIVDSVTSQDIGALPDRSVSEALQRIPGITLQRTNEARDPARLAGEGGGIFIRGLSWVRSEANGRDIFSANSGRGLSFEDVSADLLAGVDVYKNPSAEMIEGGVGGIVNLRTRLPFDSNKRLVAFSADYNYADLLQKGFTSGNALYSDQWGVGDSGRMGALFSVSIGNIGNRTDSVQTGRFEPRTAANGSTVYIPNSFGWRQIDWQQRRTAVAAAMQWAPQDALNFTLQGLYTKTNPHDIEHTLGDTDGGYATDDPSYTFGSNGVIETGTINNIKPTADTRYGKSNKETKDLSLNAKWNINDRINVSGDVQYVDSHADVVSMTAFTQLGGAPLGSLSFDLRGDTPTMSLNNTAQDEQSAYWWAAAMDHIEDNDAHSWAERLDADLAFDDNPWLQSFRVGVRATDKDAITRQTGWNWNLLSQQFWGPNNPATNKPAQVAYINQMAQSSAELFTYDNFFRGDVNLPGVAWFPTNGLVSNGRANAYEALKGTETSGWGWTPLSEDYSLAKPGGDNPNGGINTQNEKTQAAYAMLRFAHDQSPLGPWDGNIGVRAVKTKVESIGLLQIGSIQNAMDPNVCLATHGQAACAPLISAFVFALGGNQPGFTQDNDYTDVLPTLNLRFHLTDDLQLRFALGKAIVRPTFSQMMPYTTLSYTFESDGFTPDDVSPVTGTGGNPKLKPTRAKQFDTSVEWYFSPSGSVSVAGFYKNVRDYIFLGQSPETYTSNGIEQTFLVTRNMNGDKGKIKGFELAYTQFYDRLPGIFSGLGLQTNFTYVDSSGGRNTAVNILEPAQTAGAGDQTLPLEGLSKTSYNITGLYEKHDVSARLAYNWRERYLLTTSAANIQRPVWTEDYGQLDASVFYNLTPTLKLGLEGTNLLNTRTFLDVGGTELAPRYSWTDTDRRYAIAMRMQF